uniref:Uncharacterized protein n=1 Tax=Solanum lycopersicum TaxID=4081 RepID=A0A3Q7JJT5_SOLLC
MIKLSVVKVDSTMGQEWHQYVGSAVCRKENVNREFMVQISDFLDLTSGNGVLAISSLESCKSFVRLTHLVNHQMELNMFPLNEHRDHLFIDHLGKWY